MNDFRRCENLGELLDFLANVYICAPDRFLQVSGPMNLKIAFEELRHGLTCAETEIADAAVFQKANSLLEEAHAKYKAGKDIEGAHLLQDMSELLEGN